MISRDYDFFFSRFPSGNKFNAQLEENNPKDYQLDSFFSTIQNRHTYFQKPKSKLTAKKRHIRLRARQVLCHNCKNVCTENGKNAQKYKTSEVVRFSTRSRRKASFEADCAKFRDLCVKTSTLVPILKRLKDIDILRFKQKDIKKDSLKRQPKNNEITKNLNNCDKNVTNPDDIEQKSIPLKIRILPEEQETRKESRNEVQHEENGKFFFNFSMINEEVYGLFL